MYKSLSGLAKTRLVLTAVGAVIGSIVSIYLCKMFFAQIDATVYKIGDIYDCFVDFLLTTVAMANMKLILRHWKMVFLADLIICVGMFVLACIYGSKILPYYIAQTFVYSLFGPIMGVVNQRETTALFWGDQKMHESYRLCSGQVMTVSFLIGSCLCMLLNSLEVLSESNYEERCMVVFTMLFIRELISLYRDYYIRSHVDMLCVEHSEEHSEENED